MTSGPPQITWLTPTSGRTLIEDVRVLDGTGKPPIERSTMIIEGTRIVSIEGQVPASATGTRIAGAGLTALPGLIDAHVHFNGEPSTDPYSRYLSRSREVRLLKAAQDAMTVFRAGFTAVRDCGLGSLGTYLREASAAGLLKGPRVAAAYRSISHTGGHCDWGFLPLEVVRTREPRGVLIDTPEEGVKAVRENFREGATFTKVMVTSANLADPRLWPPREISSEAELRAIAEATHAHGALVAAHCMGSAGVRRAVTVGADTVEHGIVQDDWDVLRLMADRGTILVPTLSAFHWRIREGARWGVSEAAIRVAGDLLNAQMVMVRRAREAGVRIALGTDTGSTYGIGENATELELLVQAGLSPLEAITAATRTAADALGWERHIGTLAPGKLADVILVRGDPLADIGVLKGGAITHIFRSDEEL